MNLELIMLGVVGAVGWVLAAVMLTMYRNAEADLEGANAQIAEQRRRNATTHTAYTRLLTENELLRAEKKVWDAIDPTPDPMIGLMRDILTNQNDLIRTVAESTVEAASMAWKPVTTPGSDAESPNLDPSPWGPAMGEPVLDPTDGIIPDDLLRQAGLVPDLRVVETDPEPFGE
jgi:hypothetical protein